MQRYLKIEHRQVAIGVVWRLFFVDRHSPSIGPVIESDEIRLIVESTLCIPTIQKQLRALWCAPGDITIVTIWQFKKESRRSHRAKEHNSLTQLGTKFGGGGQYGVTGHAPTKKMDTPRNTANAICSIVGAGQTVQQRSQSTKQNHYMGNDISLFHQLLLT